MFKNVSLVYGGKTGGKKALDNINLKIPSGATVGIIGATGSAKSSLVQLIPRLYDVSEGSVTVGGVDVRDYDLDTLHQSVSMVLQKNELFAGSIAENLRWGDKDASDAEVRRASEIAQADDFARSFPSGHDTWIEQGGTNVSGGQKQRLCIARALLKKPKVLILDDSTSAVDTKTDALIQQGLREYMPDTTKIVIAQRVSSVKEADHHTGMWAWKHPHHDGSHSYTKLGGRIVFDHVDFGYTEDKQVLHDITRHPEPGQKIAFVGATGAGKTTITNLVNRFYDIADGKIRYDGININKIRKADLRRSLGIVLQDVHLFTGTVMENIRYGNPSATDEECIAAAKLANADSFIRMLPDGYDTVLKGDGSGLSQGQRQLVSIARAAVADPPVMILDEATSSIDTRTEALVQAGMDGLMKGRTVFVIAHRLSTVQHSDVIMVLDHGRIIERGTHDELIAKKGTYYQLYTGAFELE